MSETFIYIGRFAPFHNGHKAVIDHALTLKPERIIVVVGSAYQARSFKTPFTEGERMLMIRSAYKDLPVEVVAIPDFPYSYKTWEANLLAEVVKFEPDFNKLRLLTGRAENYFKGALAGMPMVAAPVTLGVSATDIRDAYFSDGPTDLIEKTCPIHTQGFLNFWPDDDYNNMKWEHDRVLEYRRRNGLNEYPAAIFCADAVVLKGESVVLIQRGPDSIGRGLWALPGGHVNPREEAEDAALRELHEETGLDLSEYFPLFDQCFSSPDRDARGRCITQAFIYDLPDDFKVQLKAGDDAAKCVLMPIEMIDPRMMYADHYHIIREMAGCLS